MNIDNFLDLIIELNELEEEIDKDILVTSVFSKTSIEDLMNMSFIEYENTKKDYQKEFSKHFESDKIVNNIITHNNKEYKFIIDPLEFTVKRWADLTIIENIDNIKERIIKTLCILLDTNEDYSSKQLEMYDEIKELNSVDVYLLSSFFLQNILNLKTLTQQYILLAEEITKMDKMVEEVI